TSISSAVDLVLCDPRLAPSLSWEVLSYAYVSDYLPVQVNDTYCKTNHQNSIPRWNLKSAVCELFAENVD
ncbi:hypothetical protein HHI36_005056, partial [Cryptolaemus montrouzieri]